jgi:beta-glucosidase
VYPFGYGLSYTEFSYSGLEVEQKEREIWASAAVKNVGGREGKEVVQCYIRDVAAGRVRPVKQLVAFEKITLDAGEETRVLFKIPIDVLGYYDANMNYFVEKGEFEVFVGRNAKDTLSERIYLADPNKKKHLS